MVNTDREPLTTARSSRLEWWLRSQWVQTRLAQWHTSGGLRYFVLQHDCNSTHFTRAPFHSPRNHCKLVKHQDTLTSLDMSQWASTHQGAALSLLSQVLFKTLTSVIYRFELVHLHLNTLQLYVKSSKENSLVLGYFLLDFSDRERNTLHIWNATVSCTIHNTITSLVCNSERVQFKILWHGVVSLFGIILSNPRYVTVNCTTEILLWA